MITNTTSKQCWETHCSARIFYISGQKPVTLKTAIQSLRNQLHITEFYLVTDNEGEAVVDWLQNWCVANDYFGSP